MSRAAGGGMKTQNILDESRLVHLRELKASVAALKAENAVLRDENAQLKAHLDLAITAAAELGELPAGAKLVLVDGWNLILGARKEARDREELAAQAKRYLEEHPGDRVWIVFDGPRASCTVDGRLRISYTGGAGEHRDDKFICDFLRMARFRGELDRIEVRTNDKDFLSEVRRLKDAKAGGR